MDSTSPANASWAGWAAHHKAGLSSWQGRIIAGQQNPLTNLSILTKCGHNACPFLAGTAAGSQK
jgi:hypothetical protein